MEQNSVKCLSVAAQDCIKTVCGTRVEEKSSATCAETAPTDLRPDPKELPLASPFSWGNFAGSLNFEVYRENCTSLDVYWMCRDLMVF